MSQPVNLNKFRKSKARVDGTTLAAANAVKFSQTKIEKKTQEAKAKVLANRLEQHKRET
tara:strand:- start:2606 stop:2782 length:177 start_codon:yes stop_codon:yes gene_type:complete